jgi:hypothetical protein
MNLRKLLPIAVLALIPTLAHADPLVNAAGGGAYKPGIARSWSAEGDKVTFVLVDGADAAAIVATLKDKLPDAKVSADAGKVVIAGVPMAALLEKLAGISVGDADPLAALAGLGGSVKGNEAPEAGGSIRASKPTPVGAMLGSATDAETAERFEAEVVSVAHGAAFPQVIVRLKVRRSITAGVLKGKVTAGKIIDLPVVLGQPNAPVDFSQAAVQRNLAAYYLKKGDRVIVRAVEAPGALAAIEWLERR